MADDAVIYAVQHIPQASRSCFSWISCRVRWRSEVASACKRKDHNVSAAHIDSHIGRQASGIRLVISRGLPHSLASNSAYVLLRGDVVMH